MNKRRWFKLFGLNRQRFPCFIRQIQHLGITATGSQQQHPPKRLGQGCQRLIDAGTARKQGIGRLQGGLGVAGRNGGDHRVDQARLGKTKHLLEFLRTNRGVAPGKYPIHDAQRIPH